MENLWSIRITVIRRELKQAIKATQDLIQPPSPGFRVTLTYTRYMCYRNKAIPRYFDTLRLHLQLVRVLQGAGGHPKCLISRACDSLQTGLYQVLSRGLHLDFEVLQWSKIAKILGTQNEIKKENSQLNVCASLAGSCSSSQAITVREIEGRSGWVV